MKENEVDRTCSTHARDENWLQKLVGKREGETSFQDLGLGGRIVLKWILQKYDMRVWTGYICRRIGFIWVFGFHKKLGITRLVERLLAPEGGWYYKEHFAIVIVLVVTYRRCVLKLSSVDGSSGSLEQFEKIFRQFAITESDVAFFTTIPT
jgi:hypothetical protein